MQILNIYPQEGKIQTYSAWLHLIPPFWIAMAFVFIYIQNIVETRIEKREMELRRKREGLSKNMEAYFKKDRDKFDKVSFLADMYRLMQEHLNEINK